MNFNIYTIESKGIFRKSYTISSSNQLAYTAKRKGFIQRGMTLSDHLDNELFEVKPASLFSTRTYNVFKSNVLIGEAKKNMFSNNYQFISNEKTFIVQGNFFASVFTVLDGDKEIAKVSRKRKLFKLEMTMAIQEGYHDALLLCFFMVPILVAIKRKG